MMYFMADRRLFRTISHRSEVLSDQPWDTTAPLRPELISPGRPWPSNRELFEGILWLLGSGAGWPDLAATYPSPSTCWPRLRRWQEDGTWLQVWWTLIDLLDQPGLIDGEETLIDSS